MAELDRLGALQVRVARHRPVGVALGERERAAPSAPRRARSPRSPRSRTYIATSVATWSFRERAGVQLAADRARDLGQAALDRHVDVLVGRLERELAVLELGRDRSRPGVELLAAPPRRARRRARSARAWARDWRMS